MFTLKSEAYIYLIHFLWSSDYKNNPAVAQLIQKLQLAVENHEQDVAKVLSYLHELTLSPEFETNYSERFRGKLILIKDAIRETDFSKTSSRIKFENPLRRQLDSLIAINLLTKPTTLMMSSVNDISDKIVGILDRYEELPRRSQKAIDTFLASLQNLRGVNDYQAAISLGAFAKKPTLGEVKALLRANRSEDLPVIMHMHFKFALLASRNVPLSTTPLREPIGKFREIIEQREKEGYESYFKKMAEQEYDSNYNSYLADEVIYKSPLYTTEKKKGRLGELDYSNKTKKLGLMRNNQTLYESSFPSMPLPWVADAKAQIPDLESRVTLDMIENDSIYVGGPSGMSCLLLHLMENLGNFPSIEQKQSYLAAICAYIVGGGFHSFHEVLAPAAYSLDLIPGYEVTIPDVAGHTKGAAPRFGNFFDALSDFDSEFSQLRDEAWETNLLCLSQLPVMKNNAYEQYFDYINSIKIQIDQLENIDLGSQSDNQTVITLAAKLSKKTEEFASFSIDEKINNIHKFQSYCIKTIKDANTELRYNDDWKPFFTNLLLAFVGVGLISFAIRAATGRYAFFDTAKQDREELSSLEQIIKPTRTLD